MRDDILRVRGHDFHRVEDRRQVHPRRGNYAIRVSHIADKGIGLRQKHAQTIAEQEHFQHNNREGDHMNGDWRFGDHKHNGKGDQRETEIHDLRAEIGQCENMIWHPRFPHKSTVAVDRSCHALRRPGNKEKHHAARKKIYRIIIDAAFEHAGKYEVHDQHDQ